MSGDDTALAFRLLRSKAKALTERKRLCNEGDCLPEATFRIGW